MDRATHLHWASATQDNAKKILLNADYLPAVSNIHLCSAIQSSVDVLQSQFSEYELSQEQVEHILQHWDRAQGLLLVPLPSEEGPPDKQVSVLIVSCIFPTIKLRLLWKLRKLLLFFFILS